MEFRLPDEDAPYETNEASLKGEDIVDLEGRSDDKGRAIVLITTKYKYYYKQYFIRDDSREIYNKLKSYRLENEEYPSIDLKGEIAYWFFETTPGGTGTRIVNKKKATSI